MVGLFYAVWQYKFRLIISLKKMPEKFGNLKKTVRLLKNKRLELYSHFFIFITFSNLYISGFHRLSNFTTISYLFWHQRNRLK